MTTPVQHGKCPSCGAPLDFVLGSSRAAVCGYCKALVARKGQDFTTVGKVADLIPSGSELELGTAGKLGKTAFRLVGRLQYEWSQGVWDEWYAALEDGRWGWLAEAQGRYYLTFQQPDPAPFFAEDVAPGSGFELPGVGRLSVTDVKRAKIVGAAGELPESVQLGDTPLTVDAEGSGSVFATLDFGANESSATVYLGHQVTLEQLHLEAAAGKPATGRAGDALLCPNCHAPITLRVPGESVRLVCTSCNSLLDLKKGALQLIEVLEKLRHGPLIPLGQTGTLLGKEVLVVGWMRRSCQVEGETYVWDEHLLYGTKSGQFTWLMRADGHWSIAEPVSSGDVSEESRGAFYRGELFRRFSEVDGVVDEVLGEFYWAVKVGDEASLIDFILPPQGISKEKTGTEVNWSLITHVEGAAVAEAFKLPALKHSRTKGPGPVQPWPHQQTWERLARAAGVALGILLLLFLIFVLWPRHELLRKDDFTQMSQEDRYLAQDGGAPTAPEEHLIAYVSEPFDVPARTNIQVRLHANVSNAWGYAGGGLVNQATGELFAFGLEASHYSGVSGGESWSEGDPTVSEDLGALPAGSYVLRADVQWAPNLPLSPQMELSVDTGGFSFWQFLAAASALALPLLLLWRNKVYFEKSRWEGGTVPSNLSSS